MTKETTARTKINPPPENVVTSYVTHDSVSGYESMRELHEALRSKCGADDSTGVVASSVPPVTA